MIQKKFDKTDSKSFIKIKGARVHNLKNIDVAIPRNKFVVVTGLSGSGKSSLAFDTLYVDGQRRYVESLSAYARQFLGRMSKPDVDYISGISPAIAIEQKVNTRNPRSTVGTSTEIYEYLKLLFARIGKTYSPVSGKIVKRHNVSDVSDFILSLKEDTKVIIFSPLSLKPERLLSEQLAILAQQGFSRVAINGEIIRIDEFDSKKTKKNQNISIVIDRLVVRKNDKDFNSRIADSIQTAFYEGEDFCIIEYFLNGQKLKKSFSNKFESDGIRFEEPTPNLFSFNNPYGACPKCEGFGKIIGIDEDLVIPDKSLSVYEGAIVCWKGEKMSEWKDELIMNAYKFDFPIHEAIYELTKDQIDLLWTGNQYFKGLNLFFKYVEEQTYKIQYRVMLSRYRGKTTCTECKGSKLRKDANYIKINKKSISDLVEFPISKLLDFFKNIKLSEVDAQISKRLLTEIINRLDYLNNVGLGYLTLNRSSSTLSGGESQRINLATSLGSSLVGSMYILDEPSIGLHPRDTKLLIKVLLELKKLGNTVIVVEHDEDIIRSSDQIIDIGPMAGVNGGELIFQGTIEELKEDEKSLTAQYLTHKKFIKKPEYRRKFKDFIEITGARENNLKNISIKFPLNLLCVITGVSGSGKTSLVKRILFPAIKKIHGGYGDKTGNFGRITGNIRNISSIEFVDQNPIGRSSRSNPVTYIKAFDDIRNLFANQKLSKLRGYKPGYFSFNVPGGRCDECEGEGVVKIEMQFMADIYLTCENCNGKRFKDEILDIKFHDKNISDILDLTINQAIAFFTTFKSESSLSAKIIRKLQALQDVGLGYLGLGQSSSTLSGGEAQRIKLAYFLSKGFSENPTLFIFDEPTTGLHFHDINNLLSALNALIEKGHSIIVIEHNQEIIKCADWVIDLGPEGGEKGGYVVFSGTPEDLTKCNKSYTGKYLKAKMEVNESL
ncbi:MAG: excinuclease ABC subunit UvrA [Bacteroidales bacterium]|nr:excinuclease ABC subunit UvrA [Bacteroidales bacterium]